MSPEEQEQMKARVAVVYNALGDQSGFSKEKIEETLWYYYFDVDKSLAYLQSKVHANG